MGNNALKRSARSYWRDVSGQKYFKIGWRDSPEEQLSDDKSGIREIDAVNVRPVLGQDYKGKGQFRKVVHDEGSKEFLGDKLHLF